LTPTLLGIFGSSAEPLPTSVDYLVVGGGAGGGYNTNVGQSGTGRGGGGGAGGFRTSTAFSLPCFLL